MPDPIASADSRRPSTPSAVARSTTSRPPLIEWLRTSLQAHAIPLAAVLLILASETKFVLKDEITGSGASVDIYILFEVAVYGAVAASILLLSPHPPSFAGAHPLEMGLLAYTFVMCAGALAAPSPVYAVVRAFEVCTILLVARWTRTARSDWFLVFVRAFIFATVAMVGVGVVAPHDRGPLQQERFNWLATHSTTVGQFLAVAFTLSLILAVARTWRDRNQARAMPYWLATVITAVALAANNTRGSAVAALAGITVGLILVLPRRLWVSAILVLSYAGMFVVLLAQDVIGAWFARGEEAADLENLNSRLPLWRLAVTETLSERPVMGFGLGASRSIFYEETGLGGSHNAVINVLVDLGVVGLIIWVTLLAYAGWIMLRFRPATEAQLVERTLWLATLCVLLVNGITVDGLGGAANMGMVWLFMMVARAAQVHERSRDTSPTAARRWTPTGPEEAGER